MIDLVVLSPPMIDAVAGGTQVPPLPLFERGIREVGRAGRRREFVSAIDLRVNETLHLHCILLLNAVH